MTENNTKQGSLKSGERQEVYIFRAVLLLGFVGADHCCRMRGVGS